jgi:hypothetical protein
MGIENPVFISDIINTANGTIITTKLQEIDDDDKDNPGFVKLSGEGHSFGLFILKIRQRLIRIIEKQEVRKFRGIRFNMIIDLHRL